MEIRVGIGHLSLHYVLDAPAVCQDDNANQSAAAPFSSERQRYQLATVA
jgi:hypothetical protein